MKTNYIASISTNVANKKKNKWNKETQNISFTIIFIPLERESGKRHTR